MDYTHGQVVWAQMSSTSTKYPAIIFEPKKMNLKLPINEKLNKTYVYWIGESTYSHLKRSLITKFNFNFKGNIQKITSKKQRRIYEALTVISHQCNFKIPKLENEFDVIKWAIGQTNKIEEYSHKKNLKRNAYDIPDFIKNKISKIINLSCNESYIETVKSNDEAPIQAGKKCFCCTKSMLNNDYHHPLFEELICSNCFNGCVMCMSSADEKSLLVLCDNCIRAFCPDCLKKFFGNEGYERIINTNQWHCFICSESSMTKLRVRSKDDQMNNVYKLFPAKPINQNTKESKENILVFAIDDTKKLVESNLKILDQPHKIINIKSDDDLQTLIIPDHENYAKLIIRYYPTQEKYNKKKFENMNTFKVFTSFLKQKNELQLRYPNENIYFAFEAPATLINEERNLISSLIGIKPVLCSTNTEYTNLRSRFIWSNVLIYDHNISQFKTYDIFLKKVAKDQTGMETYESSIYTIISSFIQNNLK